MDTKKCSQCDRIKPVSEFNKKKGKDCWQSYCKECALETAKKWYKDNIKRPEVHKRLNEYSREQNKKFKEAVDAIKAGLGCLACPEKASCCLDFHHVYGKEGEISNFVKHKNRARLKAELRKCVCICANCHRKVHAGFIKIDKDTILKANEALCQACDNSEFLQNRRKVHTQLTFRPKRPKPKCIDCGVEISHRHRRCVPCSRPKQVKPKCADCGKEIGYNSRRCMLCCSSMQATKITWPSSDDLLRMVQASSYVAVSKQLGVSDNAIRKRLKNHALNKQ